MNTSNNPKTQIVRLNIKTSPNDMLSIEDTLKIKKYKEVKVNSIKIHIMQTATIRKLE